MLLDGTKGLEGGFCCPNEIATIPGYTFLLPSDKCGTNVGQIYTKYMFK